MNTYNGLGGAVTYFFSIDNVEAEMRKNASDHLLSNYCHPVHRRGITRRVYVQVYNKVFDW